MTTKRGEQACAMEGLGLAGGEARSLTGGTAPTPQHSMQPTLWSWWRDVVTGGRGENLGAINQQNITAITWKRVSPPGGECQLRRSLLMETEISIWGCFTASLVSMH